MALAANALTTVQAVKDELGISGSDEDTYLETLVNRASAAVERFCNRTFAYDASIIEKVAGTGGMVLQVDQRPLLSVASIEHNGDAFDSSDYEIHDAEAGVIRFVNGVRWDAAIITNAAYDLMPGTERKLYEVTYAAGYVTPAQADADEELTRTLPYDVEEACVLACVDRYRRRGRDPSVTSESLMSHSVSYADKGMQTFDLPAAVQGMLAGWVRVALA